MTKEAQKAAVLEIISAVAEIIKVSGSVPSGHLYARLMGHMSLDNYNSIIGILKQSGKVKESNFLLSWVGGKPTYEQSMEATETYSR